MQVQASRIEDWGSPRLGVGGLGDDLIKKFWTWRSHSHAALKEQKNVDSPYYVDFSQHSTSTFPPGGVPTGTSFGDDPLLIRKVKQDAQTRNINLVSDDQRVDSQGNTIGSWGIKQDYIQDLPGANFPPMNYKQYAGLLVVDDFVKNLVKQDENNNIPRALSNNLTPAQIE